jgi:large conductance mechanosensitive channel
MGPAMIRRFRDLASEPGDALAGLIAVGLAAFAVANAVAQLGISILAQHLGSPDVLEFHLGHTSIQYDEILQAVIALALVSAGLYWGYRLLVPSQQTCPDCLSEIPTEATVCRYCTSQLGPAAPE